MTHPHAAGTGHAEPSARAHDQRRAALRVMIMILVPIGVWTLVAMIVMWPRDVADHLRHDTATFTQTGVTVPKGHVTAVSRSECAGMEGSSADDIDGCVMLDVELDEGPETGQIVQVPLQAAKVAAGVRTGDKVTLYRIPGGDGGAAAYTFAEFDRSIPVGLLVIGFVVVVGLVARLRGLMALLGLAFAAFILVKFVFPALVSGSDPVLVGLVGSAAIMFVVIYACHGFNVRSTTALLGTLFGLVLAALLGWAATGSAHLTGVTTEDDYVLAASAPALKLTSVVICGITIAGLGVLNDVTITQASAVWELAEHSRGRRALFAQAMRIGRDHIASSVYTIAFATAGASLGTLLLIALYDRPLIEVLLSELFATEIVRTLVGSIALVLAVPLTTAIAVVAVHAGRRGVVAEQNGDQAD